MMICTESKVMPEVFFDAQGLDNRIYSRRAYCKQRDVHQNPS
jgi:hypothetical protein